MNDRLRKLIRKAPIMIFMKGNPESPKCNFSRQVMDIIRPLQIQFETFDILEDDSVRQGLSYYRKKCIRLWSKT